MGGFGSTRWDWHQRAYRVEESLSLSARDFAMLGTSGRTSWSDQDGRRVGEIGWRRERGTVALSYSVGRPGQPSQDVLQHVELEQMPKPFGGFVWTWRCPLSHDRAPCGRRVLKIYLPPGGVLFGCRVCYRLAYQSNLRCDDWLRRYLERIGAGDLGAAFTAYPGKRSW